MSKKGWRIRLLDDEVFDKIYTVDNSSFPDIPGTLLIRCAGILFTKGAVYKPRRQNLAHF